MAATKRRTTKKTTNSSRSTRSPSATAKFMSSAQDLASDTTRSIKARPKSSAALAAGLVTGIAAGIAGFLAFKRSGKTWDQFSGDIAGTVKESATAAKARIKDGLEEVRTRAQDSVERRKDGLAEDKSQAMLAEEALTLKQTGKKPRHPVDETIEAELKTGAVSY